MRPFFSGEGRDTARLTKHFLQVKWSAIGFCPAQRPIISDNDNLQNNPPKVPIAVHPQNLMVRKEETMRIPSEKSVQSKSLLLMVAMGLCAGAAASLSPSSAHAQCGSTTPPYARSFGTSTHGMFCRQEGTSDSQLHNYSGLTANSFATVRCPLIMSSAGGPSYGVTPTGARLIYTDNTNSTFVCSAHVIQPAGGEFWSENRYPCRSNTSTGCTSASNADTGYSGSLVWSFSPGSLAFEIDYPGFWEVGCGLSSGAKIVGVAGKFDCLPNP